MWIALVVGNVEVRFPSPFLGHMLRILPLYYLMVFMGFVALPVIEADAFITPDGKRLYYISTRHAPETDDFDLWYVERTADGGWDEPQRLPEPVISPAAELLPRTDAAGPDSAPA